MLIVVQGEEVPCRHNQQSLTTARLRNETDLLDHETAGLAGGHDSAERMLH